MFHNENYLIRRAHVQQIVSSPLMDWGQPFFGQFGESGTCLCMGATKQGHLKTTPLPPGQFCYPPQKVLLGT